MSDTHTDESYDHHEPAEAEIMSPEAAGGALQRREPQPLVQQPQPAISPEQAKVDAIASLTMTAYAKASELKLTPEEIAGLQKEFGDEAFRSGAAGKENLIYVEHAFLRDRLNDVIGPGQWAIIPRKRWGEDFTIPGYQGKPPVDACRIYVEAMLLIRGCFVAEAVGDMTYYKNNQSQNYGDAVEGAKTAAFRRCAKELGIGLQAWKKDWCEGWWARKRAADASGRRPTQPAAQPRPAAPAPQSAQRPPARTADVVPPPVAEATEDQRNRFIALFPGQNADYAVAFFKDKGWLPNTPEANLSQLPLKHVPTTKKVADDLIAQVEAFVTRPPSTAVDAWRTYLMPWGRCKDTPLAELEKNYLYGLVLNYEVEREYNGQPKKPEAIANDEEFRRMLDDAGKHYEWIKTK